VPIKEQTVIAYILDAAREGCEMDWSRFCREVGLTPDIATAIRHAISKVGSREKMKPIKEELPENVLSLCIITPFLFLIKQCRFSLQKKKLVSLLKNITATLIKHQPTFHFMFIQSSHECLIYLGKITGNL
jgi:hypothetical protein